MSNTDTKRPVVTNACRVLADLLVVVLWTLLVTFLALGAGWSQLQFYFLLLLGVVCYVHITRPYSR